MLDVVSATRKRRYEETPSRPLSTLQGHQPGIKPVSMRMRLENFFSKMLSSKENQGSNSWESEMINKTTNSSSPLLKTDNTNKIGAIKEFTHRVLSKLASLTTSNSSSTSFEAAQSPSCSDSSNGFSDASSTTKSETEEDSKHEGLFELALAKTNISKLFHQGLGDPMGCLEVASNSTFVPSDPTAKKNRRNVRGRKRKPNSLYAPLKESLMSASSSSSLSNGRSYPVEAFPIVKSIQLGQHRFNAWYKSFYPCEFVSSEGGEIRICYRCFTSLRPGALADRHYRRCSVSSPPGKLVRREEGRSIFELDGASTASHYCRNLCLLAMFFVSGKVAHNEVEHFMFYVLTVKNKTTSEQQVVGYFSRDKNLSLNHIMSCLLILPPYMKQGHGSYLIDYSYKLANKDGMIGTPERPLSTMGIIAFRKYWCRAISARLKTYRDSSKISIKKLSEELSISEEDIVSTLLYMGQLKKLESKYYIINRK